MIMSSLIFVSALLIYACVAHPVARSDDDNPNTILIETLAAKLSTVEAELNAQKQKVTLLEGQLNQKVAFTVQMSDRDDVSVSQGQVIPFDLVTLNVGNGYNRHSNTFTAPYDGNYWFYVRLDVNNFRSFEIKRNGQGLNRCDNDGGLRSLTCGVTVTLKGGDVITVNRVDWGGSDGIIDPGPESLFSGFKI